VGLEPTKIGFADRRLDRFGIATLYTQIYTQSCTQTARVSPIYPIQSLCKSLIPHVTVRMRWFCRPLPYHLATAPLDKAGYQFLVLTFYSFPLFLLSIITLLSAPSQDEMRTGRVKPGESEAPPSSSLLCTTRSCGPSQFDGSKDPPPTTNRSPRGGRQLGLGGAGFIDDGRTDEVAPLGPGAVIVADLVEA
jgi:hypothetical protein